ncbi:ComEC/Rec2 family competence protein [Marinoscillum sp. MHG1-6]|uniref:ComEC/Rec2 family competence protein n=1 Tax=Marinoscillum sp. MHG1-6 TaxID=2959627 RepID=UPI00215871A1|nr:ComEC/Rec2 family competence protein [Marinoscillum sp. MHG1-6]
MHFWSPFPFVRISIALIVGIALQYQYQWHLDEWWGIPIVFLISLLLSFWASNKWLNSVLEVFYGLSVVIVFVYVGSLVTFFHQNTNDEHHYTRYDHADAFSVRLISDVSVRTNYHRYEAELTSVLVADTLHPVNGKMFLYVRKTDSLEVFNIGDRFYVNGNYYPVQAPSNPHTFDYKAYLEKLNIYAHAFVSMSDTRFMGNEPPGILLSVAHHIRNVCKQTIQEIIPEAREQSILMALLVGVKDYLDEATKDSYAQAGAMHVLAVSGLHVGIIYYLLTLVFGFLKRNPAGKITFILLALSIIWLYAAVTGFSPSVLRASVMFSVILLSETLSRRSNIYNSLGIAALILLLYDPFLIYSVGFQLSFLAVLGIVFFQPKIKSLWSPENKILQYFWEISCVSMAAQLVTFPLTVYYFHQLPTYFLLANLIVIPAAGLILTGGIVGILLYQLVPVLGELAGRLLYYLMYGINEAIDLLTQLPLTVVDWLYFDFWDTALVYGAILLVCMAFDYQLKRSLFAAMILFGAFMVKADFNLYDRTTNRSIIFYGIKNHVAIDFIEGQNAMLLVDKVVSLDHKVMDYQVNPNRLASRLEPFDCAMKSLDSSDAVMAMPFGYLIEKMGQRIMVINSQEEFELKEEPEVDILYLNERNTGILTKVKAKHYLLGWGIGYYAVQRIRDQFENDEVHFHSLRLDGYYELPLVSSENQSINN